MTLRTKGADKQTENHTVSGNTPCSIALLDQARFTSDKDVQVTDKKKGRSFTVQLGSIPEEVVDIVSRTGRKAKINHSTRVRVTHVNGNRLILPVTVPATILSRGRISLQFTNSQRKARRLQTAN
ncbi:hypothetical protein BH11PAT4_BH11PAT4_3040 [soil metagenome]